jgi:hypothetical protein
MTARRTGTRKDIDIHDLQQPRCFVSTFQLQKYFTAAFPFLVARSHAELYSSADLPPRVGSTSSFCGSHFIVSALPPTYHWPSLAARGSRHLGVSERETDTSTDTAGVTPMAPTFLGGSAIRAAAFVGVPRLCSLVRTPKMSRLIQGR